MYTVELARKRVEKQIADIPKRDQERVITRIRQLAENPRPRRIKQLNGNVYRLAVGNYRVIYKVFDDENLVIIGKVDRRKERTYKDWARLF